MLEIGVVLAFLFTAIGFGAAARSRRVATRFFAEYGRQRGLALSTPLELHGAAGAVPYFVTRVWHEGRVCTYVAARKPGGDAMRLRLAPKDARASRFEDAFLLRAHDVPAAQATLADVDDALRLLGKHPGMWLASDGERVLCMVPGGGLDSVVIDAAVTTVLQVAASREPTTPYR